MTSVTQLLPNFIQGINEQPDELKRPGQVRDAVNVYPDVTDGLVKRAGYEKVTDLGTDELGSWFSVYREDGGLDKRYVFNVKPDGTVVGWDADTGTSQNILRYRGRLDLADKEIKEERLVENDPQLEYLEHSDPFAIRTAVQNDAVFLCNKSSNKVVSMSKSDETERPYEAFIEIDVFDATRAYVVNINEVTVDSSKTTVATKVSIDRKINFFSAGDDDNCPLVGNYNFVADVTEEGELRAAPIAMRISIAARPSITDGTESNCRYYVQETVLQSGGRGWKKGDQFRWRSPGNDISIVFDVDEVISEITEIDYTAVSSDTDFGSVESLLEDLHGKIVATGFFAKRNVQIVGNGIYVKTGAKPFTLDTPENDIMSIINNQAPFNDDWEDDKAKDDNPKDDILYQYPNPIAIVNNASDLPLECKLGMVVKVENTFQEEDDYYVRFVNDYSEFEKEYRNVGNTIIKESGQGYWKEVAKPGEDVILNSDNMPVTLRWSKDDEWILAKIKWAERTAGTASDYNPSFVGQPINNLMFFRNRLVFLSGQSVVTSRAGDYTNLFPATALTVSPSDPVDVEANANYTANLHAGIQINNATVIFGEYHQFLLTTDSDVFSPNTAKLSQLSAYHFDINSEPFMLGTNVGFMGATDKESRLYEMTNIFREGQTDVAERSKLVYKTFSSDYSIAESSRESGLVIMAKKNSDTLWLYKYFKENSQTDVQQAWFKWTTPDPITFQFMTKEVHYAVVHNDAGCRLLRQEQKSDVYQDEGEDYELKVELPTFYVKKAEQQAFRADTTASLTLHRMHLNTGASNYYTVTMKRHGKDDYVVDYEQSIQDAYLSDAEPVSYDREETVPIYDRNTYVNITLTSTYNGPFTLYSLRWEGDYNNRYYKLV